MASTFDSSIVCPVMVGREAVLAHAIRTAGRAAEGRGAVLLISGEAGVGKSRLAAEVAAHFPASGVVLRGACFEPDRGLPFAPFADLLETTLEGSSSEEIASQLGAALPDLARIVPLLAAALGPLPEPDDPHQEQRRIAAALDDAIERLRHGRPLLLQIEDLHWADDASLDLLLRLARATTRRPILLVMTFRSDEQQPSLDHLLAGLDRERLGVELALQPFNEREIDLMLRSIFHQSFPISTDFRAAMLALTDGNPFFIEEVLRALIAAGDIYQRDGIWQRKEMAAVRVPRSVQDAVARQAARLSQGARDVLRVAAVSGQRFEFDTILALVRNSESDLLEIVRELVVSQLVVEESPDRFAFRHALTRAALYGEMLGRERRTLHRAIGDTIERQHAEELTTRAADLAYHFHAAEDWPKALRYARLAGDHARALGSPQATIEHADRAITAAARIGESPPIDQLRQRALARATLGQFAEAEADQLAVLAAARAAGNQKAEWQALGDLADLSSGRDYARAGDYVRQAYALAREMEDSRLIARSLVQLGNWQVNRELVDEAEASLRLALPIFEAAGDRRGMAETLDLLGIVADIGGDVAEMCRSLKRARDVYRELDDRRGLSSVLATLTSAAGHPVFETVIIPTDISTADVIALATESLDLARQIDWRAGEAYATLNLGAHLAVVGDIGRARATLDDGVRIAEEIGHQEWIVVGHLARGWLRLFLLDIQAAVEHFASALALGRSSGTSHFQTYATAIHAAACIEMGDLDAAATSLATLDPEMPTRTVSQRFASMVRGMLALAQGDATTALQIADDLLATAIGGAGDADIPHVALLRGQALAALGRTDAAIAALRAAASGASARRLRCLLLRIHQALEHVLRTAGRTQEAAAARRAATATAGQIAATIPDDTERAAFLARAGAGPAAEAPRANGLTPREREVAAEVARGLTNREIADALFIGQRTVETHITNILTKLNFSTRSQIAVWAVRQDHG